MVDFLRMLALLFLKFIPGTKSAINIAVLILLILAFITLDVRFAYAATFLRTTKELWHKRD